MTRLAARGRLDEAIPRGDLRIASSLFAAPYRSMLRRIPPLPLGQDVPEGQETNPQRLGRPCLDQRRFHPDGPGPTLGRGQFHVWDGPASRAEIRAQVTQSLAVEFDRLDQMSLVPKSSESECSGGNAVPRLISVNSRLVGDEPSFGRDPRAAIPRFSRSRIRLGGARVAHYRGIRLRNTLDPYPR